MRHASPCIVHDSADSACHAFRCPEAAGGSESGSHMEVAIEDEDMSHLTDEQLARRFQMQEEEYARGYDEGDTRPGYGEP